MPDHLLTSPWILACRGEHDLEGLLRPMAEERHFAAGSLLCEQGEVMGGVYYLVQGRVKQSVISPAGMERLLTVLESGCLVGESSALDGEPMQVGVTALADTVALFVESVRLHLALRQNPALALCVMQSLTQKLRTSVKLVTDQSLRSVPDQLSCLLHQLTRQKGPDRAGSGQVTLPISHQELADMLGVSRVTISQGLAALKERGLIETGHRQIYVLRPGGLKSCGEMPYCISHRPLPVAGD